MEYEFYQNPDIDMTKIADSMQLDSGQVVASLQAGGIKAAIEVCGDVRVWWNEKAGGPWEGDYFVRPSDFPDKLKRLVAGQYTSDDGYWTNDPRVYVDNNNWFEMFIGTEKNPHLESCGLVDIEGYTPDELLEVLKDAVADYSRSRP